MVLAAGVEARLGRQVLALGSLAVGLGCVLLAVAPSAGPSAELVPGLALIGFGIGLVLVPLSQTVLADVEPAHVGAAAGVLATAQQVGGGLGVAVIGVVFFDAAGRGLVHAFTVSLWVLAALTLGTAALVQALPRKGR
jgi:MFS family permease